MIYYGMWEKVNEDYKNIFLNYIPKEERLLPGISGLLEGIDKGIVNFQHKRIRLITLPSDTPRLDMIEWDLKRTIFPIISMDDSCPLKLDASPGCGDTFWGIQKKTPPKLVAARTLNLLSNKTILDKSPILNILMPERKTRICLKAMDILQDDFNLNLIKVRSVWRALC